MVNGSDGKVKKTIRVLIVDDSKDDKDLLLLELRRGGFEADYKHVQTSDEFRKSLGEEKWELILCDYSMPEFDGLSALRIVKERGLDIPFILISGAIGEDIAVKAMKAGAHDYLFKGNLQRLNPAIERELKEAEIRKLHKKAEEERTRLLKVIQQSLNEIYLFDSETLEFEYVNQAALNNLGFLESEMKQRTPLDINPDLDENIFKGFLASLRNGNKDKIEFLSSHKRKDGSQYPVETHLQWMRQDGHDFFAAINLDLTHRERDALIIKEQKKLAEELALSSKYKSEFLANMSHELRTPLNSIILLSKLLADNRSDNLNEDQLEYVNVIHNSGNNLLELINEILDLSKIEAGEMNVKIADVKVDDICDNIEKMFRPVADEKEIKFTICQKNLPRDYMVTDQLRVEPVLNNFLSNANKFIDEGSVDVSVDTPEADEREGLNLKTDHLIAFRVKDTGIGIPREKQKIIFEAFQQADGSTQRKYGGTGLGLSICRRITSILEGQIRLSSEEGVGSTVTLYLPFDSSGALKQFEDKKMSRLRKADAGPASPFEGQIIFEPEERALAGHDETTQSGPSGRLKKLLLVDDSHIHVSALKELLETAKKRCLVAGSAREAYAVLESEHIDCMVLDIGLPDESGFDVVRKIKSSEKFKNLPVILYTGKSLSPQEEEEFNDLVYEVIIKTSGSFNKLKNRINKVLNLNEEARPVNKRVFNEALSGKKILIVDDDQRNVYSLSSVLKEYQVAVTSAANGSEALNKLKENSDIDAVLMDMMMPVMNGFEAIKTIRQNPKWNKLPVIAVTAKAMIGDREKCIRAGASDYVSKPVDSRQLVELLSGWL